MHILFTGASGFIGQHFIRFFTQYKYTVLTRSPSRVANRLPDNVKFISSLTELDNLNEFDAVINLAGEPIIDKRWTKKQKAQICQSRWQTTQTLVDLFAASSKPPSVLVNGSAIGFYGEGGARQLTEQDQALSDDFAHQICDKWETIARQAQAHTRVVLLRTGIVLGDGGALSKMLLPFKLGLGGKIGDGQQYMSWIHIKDMIRAIDFLLIGAAQDSVKASGPYNLTAPRAVSNAVFSNVLAEALGTKARLPLPELLLKLLMGESAALLLGSQNIYPEALLNRGFEFAFADLEPALLDLLNTEAKTDFKTQ